MSDYIQQPDETMPNSGGNKINHLVKSFAFETPLALDAAVTLFMLGLRSLAVTPIIKSITYQMAYEGAPSNAMLYSSQIHYVLVE